MNHFDIDIDFSSCGEPKAKFRWAARGLAQLLLLLAQLLSQPGASAYFGGGVVCYTKDAKQTFLGLDPEKTKPTSTEPHALELAMAIKEKLNCEWAIGETGTAGPKPNS